MRIHITKDALAVFRNLRTPATVRQAIRSLLTNPHPDWAITSTKGALELLIDGWWITFEVDETGAETIVTVLRIAQM